MKRLKKIIPALAALLGFSVQLDAGTAAPEPGKAAGNLGERIDRIQRALDNDDKRSRLIDDIRIAQWYNWPNWPNWNNWPNWGNWYNY